MVVGIRSFSIAGEVKLRCLFLGFAFLVVFNAFRGMWRSGSNWAFRCFQWFLLGFSGILVVFE